MPTIELDLSVEVLQELEAFAKEQERLPAAQAKVFLEQALGFRVVQTEEKVKPKSRPPARTQTTGQTRANGARVES